MIEFIVNWVAATPEYAAPLLLACLGLIINERAGVLNLGAEGMMACGALSAAVVSLVSGWPWLGMLGAVGGGALVGVVFGLVTVGLRANQVITGLITVAFGAGITGLLGRDYVSRTLPGFEAVNLGFLSELAWIGPVAFSQSLPTYLAALSTPLVWYCLFKTVPGLRLRAVGEDPATADAAGVSVVLVRLLAVTIGGAFCGAAGGYLSLASSQIWVEGMVAGRGWIAIGLVIFARWRPGAALGGALLFGAIEALIPRVQALGADVPIYLMMMLPYLATLGVLVLVSARTHGSSNEPGSLGIAYARQDRH
ncbi:MAG: ABC transporter permease [Gammaproteobacteria bacterium]